MARRKPSPVELGLLLFFHAAISGAFLVAYITGDEDTYGMHVVAGYAALGALILRLAAAAFAPAESPLRLPGPRGAASLKYLGRLLRGDPAARQERSPLYAWMAAVLLVGVGLAALSGAAADFLPSLEDMHEAFGEFALYIALGHVAVMLLLWALKQPGRSAAAPRSSHP